MTEHILGRWRPNSKLNVAASCLIHKPLIPLKCPVHNTRTIILTWKYVGFFCTFHLVSFNSKSLFCCCALWKFWKIEKITWYLFIYLFFPLFKGDLKDTKTLRNVLRLSGMMTLFNGICVSRGTGVFSPLTQPLKLSKWFSRTTF